MKRRTATTEHFFELTPERVLAAVEAGGHLCTGLCYPLNSMENRVYELELEDRSRVIAKFYRPGRWSADAIFDEHQFLFDCIAAEIPVVTPLTFPDGATLREAQGLGIYYALFAKTGGRQPDELTHEQARSLGMLAARIHNVGASGQAKHRITLDLDTYGVGNAEYLLASGKIPPELRHPFAYACDELFDLIAPLMEGVAVHRIHGDCHLGNLLFNKEGPFFLDFDDMCNGPAVQDLWLMTPSRDDDALRVRESMIEGYTTFRAFDRATLKLVEPLRALRYLHYAAWVTRRWEDPSFPRAFPHYGTFAYWQQEVHDLAESNRIIEKMLRGDEPEHVIGEASGDEGEYRFYDDEN